MEVGLTRNVLTHQRKDIMIKHPIRLRHWNLKDANALKWLTSHADYRYVDDMLPQCMEAWQAEKIVKDFVDRTLWGEELHLAVECDDRVVGAVGVTRKGDNYRQDGVLRCMLLPEACGRGIGTEVIRRVVQQTLGKGLYRRLTARVFIPKVMAARALERNGFVREGVMRRSAKRGGLVYDEFVYGLMWCD